MSVDVIGRIFELFERFGAQHYGEDATQLQHALQTAELARGAGCADTLVAAALLHDIGQLMDDAGEAAELFGVDARHEIGGALFLSKHFPPAVCEPVRLHVAAKRYLCAVDRSYADGLSRASALSLKLQGGPMSADEVRAFEAEPFFEDAVTLRRFDDAGKRPDRQAPDLAGHRPLLESLLASDAR
ncbi:HD domain-containing protein [Phenylobacterium sp.]|uniref:HD domain-containing protein n=1 Tax=Phenylobacterium sp. TaxID=1871053 RepID=UPI0035B37527